MFILKNGEYRSSLIDSSRITHGFGTRASVPANTFTQTIRGVQTHSTHIAHVSNTLQLTYNDTDGLITHLDGVNLTIKTADCVPVIYSDSVSHIIGIAHMGWKGIYHNFSSLMIAQMVQAGADRENIRVAIGPSIGPCCYRIFGERLNMFRAKWPEETSQSLVTHMSETYLNLSQILYIHTMKAGIPEDNIDYKPFCTRCDNDHFNSFQREGTGCKHMISHISLLPDTI